MKLFISLVCALALTACKEAPAPDPAAAEKKALKPAAATKAEKPKAKAPKAEAPATKVAARKPATSLTTGHTSKKSEVEWAGPVQWTEWDAAQAKAKKDNKPICLVVYADWCPRCRELAPAFAEDKIAKLADKMVMVRQNADARPAWLEDLKTFGTYVPRIFFFSPDGSLREEITSKHPRYPYFYTPKGLDSLAASMQSAVDG